MPVWIPRWVGLLTWQVLLGTVHVAFPLELSRLGRRHGWCNGRGRPGPANVVGLVPLVAGATLICWALVEHARAVPNKGWAVRRGLEPEYLLTDGPYRLSRNPMHVGGIGIWAGWMAWFGSAPVGVGLAVATAIYRAGVGWEERILERRWGSEWLAYAKRTPRWVSLRPRGAERDRGDRSPPVSAQMPR
jgi:protein-S-isoprenylcysteine O-methyltransferase Ste14